MCIRDRKDRLPSILAEYELSDIYNPPPHVDKAGLYFRGVPNKSLTLENEVLSLIHICKFI